MWNKKDGSTPKDKGSRGGTIRKSYDTIPQPKGKFKDLFRQMQEQKVENTENSTQPKKPSK
jgi:hypothetical protein